jgi:hypothetical protein
MSCDAIEQERERCACICDFWARIEQAEYAATRSAATRPVYEHGLALCEIKAEQIRRDTIS